MSKIGTYQPPDRYKNYSLPTSKPLRSHPLFEEKVWTLQQQIFKKLGKVAHFLESLYPKLTDDFSKKIKPVIEKNIETLIHDLDLMQTNLHKNPYSFNTSKLKTNQRCITEMKNVCDTLQTVSTYELESKILAKIKHALNELEHLIRDASPEKSVVKAPVKKAKPATKLVKSKAPVAKAKKVVKKETKFKPPAAEKKKF